MTASSRIPLWGHAWKLTVRYVVGEHDETNDVIISTDAWEPEALRISFEVVQSTVGCAWWFADINVYNLNRASIQSSLFNAVWVILEAGFQTGSNKSSIIWSGPVLQTLFTRENVVDQRITFHCVANPLLMDEIIAFPVGPFMNQTKTVALMADAINVPVELGSLAQQRMDTKIYPRGTTVFGKMSKYMAQIASDNFMQQWQSSEKAFISEIQANPNVTPDLVYSPPFGPDAPEQQLLPFKNTQSIIGTPVQTQFGVIFTVFLDPRLAVKLPPMVVSLQRTLINQLQVQTPGQGAVSPYATDLKFLVAQVRHIGDSRGNEWYSEVTGYSTTYADSMLNGVFAANSGGG